MATETLRYFTKAQLIAANEEAIKSDRNRTVEPRVLQELNPDGIYPVTWYLDHNYCEARLRVIINVVDGLPIAVMVDVPYSTYEALDTMEVPARPGKAD